MAGRGQLTSYVQTIAKNNLGREITLTELRLMPYVQYLSVNSERVDPGKLREKEREVLSEWREAEFIEGGASEKVTCSLAFWRAICEIIFAAYVIYDQLPDEEVRQA